MENMIKLSNGKYAEIANYRDQPIAEYQNPLIEALPPLMSKQEVAEKIGNYPHISEEERELDAHYRMHLVQRVFQYFQPLPFHINLEQSLSRIIRQSYISRNPFSPEYAQSFHRGWKDIEQGFSSYQFIQNATAFSTSVVGISGMGKTTSIDRILKLIPQIIVHSNYKGKELNLVQVPHIKIQTAFDGSLKSLSLDFMRKVDELVGTNYFEKYGKKSRLSTNTLLPLMGQIARSIHLGVLVIDEIQHLTAARIGAEKTLNYFVTLVNELGIPIVFISTPKGISVLQSEFRQARRSSGQGSLVLDRLEKNSVWHLFIEGLWRYQWTKQAVELDAELNDTIYEVSQGILDIACKVFVMSQLRAISNGQEKITPALIRKVADEQFRLIKPIMEAIKEGKTSKLAMYEDVVIPDISSFINKEQSKLDLSILMKKETASRIAQITSLKEDAVFRLHFLGIAETDAKRAVDQYLNSQPQNAELNSVVKAAYLIAIGSIDQISTSSQQVNKVDLRAIVGEGKSCGLSAYEALKQAGYIRV